MTIEDKLLNDANMDMEKLDGLVQMIFLHDKKDLLYEAQLIRDKWFIYSDLFFETRIDPVNYGLYQLCNKVIKKTEETIIKIQKGLPLV